MNSLNEAQVAEICTEYVNGGLGRFRSAVNNGTSSDIIHLTMGLVSIAGYKPLKALARVQAFLTDGGDVMTPDSISEAVEAPRNAYSQPEEEEEEEEETEE